MDKKKFNKMAEDWKQRLLKEYTASVRLQELHKSFTNYLESQVDAVFLKSEFERDSEIRAEFGKVENFIGYVQAKKAGLVLIIGGGVTM